jgi:hypothetical protein
VLPQEHVLRDDVAVAPRGRSGERDQEEQVLEHGRAMMPQVPPVARPEFYTLTGAPSRLICTGIASSYRTAVSGTASSATP